MPTDVRVLEAEPHFTVERSVGGLIFSRGRIDDLTLCHVRVVVESRRGAMGQGWGAVLPSHPWALPKGMLPAADADRAMRAITSAWCRELAARREYGHPVDTFMELEAGLPELAARSLRDLGLAAEWPHLASLVCVSPADAALHDAFGVANGVSTYAAYGRDACGHDLSRHLGQPFRGRFLDQYLTSEPAPRIALLHNVGLEEPLSIEAECAGERGEARSLEHWVTSHAIRHVKVKLQCADLDRDRERVREVHQVVSRALSAKLARPHLSMSLDANEQGGGPEYLTELLSELRATSHEVFDAIRYVEQPVPRGQLGEGEPAMRRLTRLKPMILDEGYSRLTELPRASEAGWSGIALKTCKGQSLMLLTAALAASMGLLHPMQDLTNLGIAMLQSIGFAARLPARMPVETNGRQYFPQSSAAEATVHPCIDRVEDGSVSTASLVGPGLGYQIDRIERAIFR
jgi:L-alanine-DL-glutamate epimerase-like enolase superfamily enzyme